VFDSGEKSALTDAGGNWTTGDMAAGKYVIRVWARNGWSATVGGSSRMIALVPAGVSAGKLFGQRRVA
jgi:hypothetical protein